MSTSNDVENGQRADDFDNGNSHKAGSLEAKSTPPSPFPEGGTAGWMAVIGAFAVLFFTWGYLNAFGVYESYYLSHQLKDRSPSDVAWIGSLQVFFFFSSGLISGPFTDRFGPQLIIWPCSFLFVLSVMLNSLCTEFYQFILAQGILGGLSSGLCFTPALAIIGHYFLQKRAPMMAIATTGSALGGILFPIILNRLLNSDHVSFGWTVRTIGFIMLALCAVASATIRPRLPRRSGTYFLPHAFKQADFTLQIASCFLIVWGLMTPFFYLPRHAETVVHLDGSLSFYIVTILNTGSFFGRLGFGALSNKLGRFNVTITAATISAVLIFAWLRIETKGAEIAFAVLYGATSGAYIAMLPAVLAQVTPQPQMIGTYIGMAMGICGLAGLTGTPITGALINSYGRFDEAFIFSGVVMLAGVAFLVAARFAHASWKVVV